MADPASIRFPADPFALDAQPPYRPLARRVLPVFGHEVELVLLPDRACRRGAPAAGRPPFAPSAAPRILAAETSWTDGVVALTPNRHPFARQHLLVWPSTAAEREPTPALLVAAFELARRTGGTALVNSIGAAASIATAHAHVLGDRLAFLGAFSRRPARLEGLEPAASAEWLRAPFAVLALRGSVAERAATTAALLGSRTTPAFNVLALDGDTWLVPRSAVETPAPHFPWPLGAAELGGRWCYAEAEPFERATGAALESALLASTLPPAAT